MTTYVVSHNSSVDCYKRAETFNTTIFSGSDRIQAFTAAVNCWLDLWNQRAEYFVEDGDRGPLANELAELIPPEGHSFNEQSLVTVHEWFEENAYTIWEPEYINCPTEEVMVQVVQDDVEIKVDEEVLGDTRRYLMASEA